MYNAELDMFDIHLDGKIYFFDDHNNKLLKNAPNNKTGGVGICNAGKNLKKMFYVKIIPSNYCQLSCKYCFSHKDRHAKQSMLNFDDIKSKLVEIRDSFATIKINFTGGGEPTTNVDAMKSIIDLFDCHLDVKFNISTNGLFDEKTREWLTSAPFENIIISLDGAYDYAAKEQIAGISRSDHAKTISNALYLLKANKDVKLFSVSSLETIMEDPKCLVEASCYFVDNGFTKFAVEYDAYLFYRKLSDNELDQLVQSAFYLMEWKRNNKECKLLNTTITSPSRFDSHDCCSGLIKDGNLCTFLPDGTISFCHRIQDGIHFNGMNEWRMGKLQQVEKSPLLQDAVKTTKHYKRKCKSCISRQICYSHLCPAVIYGNNENVMAEYCRNMIFMREAILSREIYHNLGG